MRHDCAQSATTIVISDLHLAAGRHDPFSDDAPLAGFLDALARRAGAGEPLRLVLLGDTLDFALVEHGGRRLDPTAAGALARLERIAAAHADVFAALARAAGAGVAVEFVPGNHDLELLVPAVFDGLRALVSDGVGSPTLHPWILHLHALAYLEHGQQHHDLNRVPGLLSAAAGGTLRVPAGTIYGEELLTLSDRLGVDVPIERLSAGAVAAAARRRPARLGRVVAPMVGAARRLSRCEREARSALRAGAASAGCDSVAGLPAATVRALDRVGASTPAGAVRRRLRTRSGAEPYMVGGARAVDRLLAAAGLAVPYYIFAHTHVAADRRLAPERGAPHYLNPGTWSRLAPDGARRRCYVELRSSDGEATSARLLQWPGR